MIATVHHCRDPFNPGRRETRTVRARRTLRELAPATTLPHICVRNGQPVLRAGWNARVVDGDVVAFVILPQGGGGGGSNPMRTVLSIALAVMAPGIGEALNLAMFQAGSSFAFALSNQVLGSLASFAIQAVVGGALAGKPSQPAAQQAAAVAAPSPTYNLQAQGNAARLDFPIPVQYGRMMAYPDFAAHPYSEYAGNDQYLYSLLCIGQGEYDIEAIRIDDTPISSFEEITSEIVPPGGTLTLFPANVVTAAEVSGQELANGATVGPYVVNAAGTTANALAVDIVAPRGLYYANDSGGLDPVSVSFTVEARTIDDSGTPTGSWVTLGTETLSRGTNTPQRCSYRYSVGGGRYEMQVTRTSAPGGSSRYGDDIAWASARAYLPETRDFGDVTLLALRMRASNNLSGTAARKINVISTRRLRVWSAETGWSALQPTRSLAWAMADAAQAAYGGRLADARIDLAALAAIDATLAARGDTFDGRFDSAGTLWESLTRIGQAARVKPFLQGGVLRAVRDEPADAPVALFTARNIVKGSLSIDYLMPTPDTPDAIEVNYFDESVWAPRRVTAKLAGSTAAQPYKLDLFGVTQREQAYREGMYYAGVNRYRRKRIKFSTEMEGFIPSFGDLIAIAHDMPAWGQGGEVVAHNPGTQTLTLSEPVVFGAGPHYIGLRTRDGAVDGPHAVTAGATAFEVVYADPLGITPDTGGDRERTHFSFGPGDLWRQPARVTGIRPRSLTQVEIEAVNEDDSVHTADSGATAPAAQYSLLPSLFTAPVVAGLTVRSAPGDAGVMLISWQAAPGASRYLVEVSADGDTWSRVAETSTNNATAPAVYGPSTLIRVAADGMTRGPWVIAAYGASSDYFWSGTDSNLMWSGTDSTPFWSS